jgi:hypothetical protein
MGSRPSLRRVPMHPSCRGPARRGGRDRRATVASMRW